MTIKQLISRLQKATNQNAKVVLLGGDHSYDEVRGCYFKKAEEWPDGCLTEYSSKDDYEWIPNEEDKPTIVDVFVLQ